uniref:Alternative protein ATRX n=1 Tax=Homo sapiens TaxID=9606 RepID=L8E6W5_HUMAN|nr:alternative protein ATRX [Homo sapiens]
MRMDLQMMSQKKGKKELENKMKKTQEMRKQKIKSILNQIQILKNLRSQDTDIGFCGTN